MESLGWPLRGRGRMGGNGSCRDLQEPHAGRVVQEGGMMGGTTRRRGDRGHGRDGEVETRSRRGFGGGGVEASSLEVVGREADDMEGRWEGHGGGEKPREAAIGQES